MGLAHWAFHVLFEVVSSVFKILNGHVLQVWTDKAVQEEISAIQNVEAGYIRNLAVF